MSALLRPWTRFLPVFLALIATAFFLQAREHSEILPPHAELSMFLIAGRSNSSPSKKNA